MLRLISFVCLLSVAYATTTNIPWSKCDPGSNNNCLVWNNTTTTCEVKDCWKYDETAGCEKAGKPFMPAIILQSIPFTGFFGSGFGNIGRWDIFSTYMLGFCGLPVLYCVIVCSMFCCCTTGDVGTKQPLMGGSDDNSAGFTILSASCGCVWAVLMITMWIWGIITIAGKQVDAPWESANGTSIMCPMV